MLHVSLVAEVDVDVLSVSSDAIANPKYSMSAALHAEAVKYLDSEQAACASLRRSKEDCVALLTCAEAVLAGSTTNPAIAELVGVLRLTREQVCIWCYPPAESGGASILCVGVCTT